jgi:hypothetical protein
MRASIQPWQRLKLEARNKTIVFVGDQAEPSSQDVCMPTKTIISFVSCGSYFFEVLTSMNVRRRVRTCPPCGIHWTEVCGQQTLVQRSILA